MYLFETFGGWCNAVKRLFYQMKDKVRNKLSKRQHEDEASWSTRSWLSLEAQRMSVALQLAAAEEIATELRLTAASEDAAKRSLHAAIFGDDSDSDGDDNLPSLAHPESEKAMLTKLKPRRGKIVRSREALTQEVVELQQQMEAAAERDDDAVALLPEVVTMLNKRHMQEVLIDQGMLTTLAMWLKPMPDGSLVSLQVRTDLLRVLGLLEVDETVLGSLRSSSLGKYARLYSLSTRRSDRLGPFSEPSRNLLLGTSASTRSTRRRPQRTGTRRRRSLRSGRGQSSALPPPSRPRTCRSGAARPRRISRGRRWRAW
ncbi:hypothetical protein EMIHUDRAFT_458126, partial [Emiliania huxleyi CCMP1516]|uniref:Uncharacterized protein n=2 Tax=Emiliania huxleyi TaxID=2903 RepID=A0A0D3JGD9_EMIH1